MAEFEDKLNSLLSNPEAMSQIMQMAQSLGAGKETQASPPPQASAPPPPPQPPLQSAPSNFDPSFLSSLTGGIDPTMIGKLLPLIQELGGGDSNARHLLLALRPYLKAERQEKVERALQLARLFRIGKRFLSEWEGK